MQAGLSFSIKDTIAQAERMLTRIERKQIPFATALAQTRTVKDARRQLTAEIPRAFDRPTNITRKSIDIDIARPKTPEKGAAVYVKDGRIGGGPVNIQSYLKPQISGGPRRRKGIAHTLQSAGKMGKGGFVVPGKGVRLNRFGNVSSGMHTKAISAAKAFSEVGFTANASNSKHSKATQARNKLFVVRDGRGIGRSRKRKALLPGIYQRSGKKRLKSIFIFVNRAPRYRQRFKFWRIAQTVVTQRFPIQFKRALRDALRTAR